MKNVLLLALAVFCIFALASEASAHGPQQFRGRRQVQRRSNNGFSLFSFNANNDRRDRRRDDDFDDGFAAGVRAAQQQQQFNRFQQFRGHHN